MILDDREALERFKDEQMMQALEQGWFNAHYAWLFRDKVRPPDPVAEEVAGWFKLDPETGNHIPTTLENYATEVMGLPDWEYNDYVYETSVELFEELERMAEFSKLMGSDYHDDDDYRLIEWRAW